jgi:dTDP-glucose 4,6-dehydratase
MPGQLICFFHEAKNPVKTYNIGGDNEWTNLDLIKTLCLIMDEKLGREKGESEKLISFVTDRAGHDLRYAIDFKKINSELGWKPSLDFKEGLEHTVDWYLTNEKWLNNVVSGDYKNYYNEQYSNR